MRRLTQISRVFLFWSLLCIKYHQAILVLGEEAKDGTAMKVWSWDRILKNNDKIVANGNVWPAPEDESAGDCLIVVTHNQIMWHCPTQDVEGDGDGGESGDDQDGQKKKSHSHRSTVIFRTSGGRIRGAFSAPGTDRRRLWLLESPRDRDLLMELDTVSGEILQVLEIKGTLDGHDAVRVDDRVFVVDTRHGRVIEIELPASAPPYTESSIAAGARKVRKAGFATIVKRLTKTDHINGVAIHPQLLLSNLHGGSHPDHIIPDTRLTALSKSMSEEDGRELNEEQDGFTPVSNVGTWCHNIAFWEDEATSDIRLISLDSMAGTLVSVSLSGPNRGQRKVLWAPDPDHPVLIAPEGVAKAYDNEVRVFTKGLAVQGGVAYFAASYARAPPLRRNVPETLLVAVDLSTKKELWTRTIRSNGLVNQILTESYIGWQVQLPTELSSTELTFHGGGGSLVDHCDDMIPKGSRFCKRFEKDYDQCDEESTYARKALEVCCACDGGNQYRLPLMAGKLDEEIMQLEEDVTATATFVDTRKCTGADENKRMMKHLPLAMKSKDKIQAIDNFDRDIDNIVKHICNLNVAPLQGNLTSLLGSKEEAYSNAQQQGMKMKMDTIQLIHSSRHDGNATKTFQLPELDGWLPTIEEFVLQPLGLPLERITQMMFTTMPNNSVHSTKSLNSYTIKHDPWMQKSHRVHIPIITHPDTFFLTEIVNTHAEKKDVDPKILRIRSNPGEVYEFNNAMPLTEYNYGDKRRVHLVLDWVEDNEEIFDTENLDTVKLSSGDYCTQQLQYFNLPYSLSQGCNGE